MSLCENNLSCTVQPIKNCQAYICVFYVNGYTGLDIMNGPKNVWWTVLCGDWFLVQIEVLDLTQIQQCTRIWQRHICMETQFQHADRHLNDPLISIRPRSFSISVCACQECTHNFQHNFRLIQRSLKFEVIVNQSYDS